MTDILAFDKILENTEARCRLTENKVSGSSINAVRVEMTCYYLGCKSTEGNTDTFFSH